MTIKATTDEKHEIKHRILIGHKDLEKLVAQAAIGHLDVSKRKPKIGAVGVTYKVVFEEATEGSPPYRVGTSAIVEIIEDMRPQDATAPLYEPQP